MGGSEVPKLLFKAGGYRGVRLYGKMVQQRMGDIQISQRCTHI